MKTAVLFSGGKDSNFTLWMLKEFGLNPVCLINIISKNNHSYMFQSAGNNVLKYQSMVLNLPLLTFNTIGIKELELYDLEQAIIKAKKKYDIEAVATGAIESVYQNSRIQEICHKLELECFNPLWQINSDEYLNLFIKNNFKIIIVGIYSYPLTKKYLSRILSNELLQEFKDLSHKCQFSLIGEGGEFETLVIDSPLYEKQIKIIKTNIEEESINSATLNILDVKLMSK